MLELGSTNAEPTADGCPPLFRAPILKPDGERVGDTDPLPLHPFGGPLRWEYDRPHSIGRVRAFYGNTGMFIRALAYILANGPDGLRQTTEDAVLNANYIRKKLEDLYELPYKTASMHEVVFSDKRQAAHGVKTGDIAKRLIDYGFHPYTVSFPLIVHGALMIEPTESESREELDLFIDAMRSIAREAEENPRASENRAALDARLAARRGAGRAEADPALEAADVARISRRGLVLQTLPEYQTRYIPRSAARLHSSSEWPALLHRRLRAIAGGSRRRPPATCTWAMRAPSGQRFSARARRAARSSCAWRIWTPTAAARSTPRPLSTICAGWESAGRRGPDKGGPFAPYVQSKRRAVYLDVWRKLLRTGRLFPCRCSRKDLANRAGRAA